MLAEVTAQNERVGFLTKVIEKDGVSLPYRLASLGSEDPRPLVVFLHGAGERGADNQAQLKHGVSSIVSWCTAEKQDCLILAPQCPRESWWSNFDGDFRKPTELELKAGLSPQMALIFDLVDGLVKEGKADPNRIYITGLSMGGYGTFDAISRRPELFAAAMPICGGGSLGEAQTFAKLPLWIFHGGKDKVVPPELSREMVGAVKKAGGDPKYREYPDAGHDSWTATYADPEVLKWLFAQQRDGE